MKTISFIILNAWLIFNIQAQPLLHPRGLIKPQELETLRQKVQKEPFATMVKTMEKSLAETPAFASTVTRADLYPRMDQITRQAAMYLFTGNSSWAEACYQSLIPVLNDSGTFNNPLSFGLTRALCLRGVAVAYDFCYNGWTDNQRKFVNQKLLEAMYNLQASMGTDSNFNIESNWMGVRYGSTCLASLVYDETGPGKSRALPVQWDDIKRLGDHTRINIYSNGWNGESMGYHTYGWSFVGPAIIALQNNTSANAFELPRYVPNAVNTLWGLSTSTVAIETTEGHLGVKADLSDDNLNINLVDLVSMAFRIYPEEQKPALAWMFNYLFNPLKDISIYAVLYYPENCEPKNPQSLHWLNYNDPDQGVVVFRNRFRDNNDIVCTYSATAKRIRGHQSHDTNTLRLIGLNSIWITGAGRTGEIAGQSNVFPDTILANVTPDATTGKLVSFITNADGSGSALGTGSCMKVEGLSRSIQVDYSKKSGAEAVIIEDNRSQNGRLWRINTPEFNTITETSDGFILTSPTGATLKATVFKNAARLKIGKVRYGGKTTDHNTGISYQGKNYEFLSSLDYKMYKDILVVYTLQPAGREHPNVSIRPENNTVLIGKEIFKL